MTTATDTAALAENVKAAADKVAKLLPQDGEISSWELRTKLHLSSSLLYLALGYLLAQGRISMAPDQLNYRVLPPQH